MPRRSSRQQEPAAPIVVNTNEDEEEDASASCCAICLEPIKDGGVPLSCSHVFHAGCIVPWLQKGNRSCPTCRDKPPRLNLGEDDDTRSLSDYADSYDDEPENDASHQALHAEWEATWSDYLRRVHESEAERKKSTTSAMRM